LHRSVRENIAYSRQSATEEQIVKAAEKANALHFIESLRDAGERKGLDAMVGERGVTLSGGQRQRIAIAPTSALDSEVEAAIQDNLQQLMQDKTVIAIAHRLSTIAQMDRLIVMEKGFILETGSHKQLIENDGLYASLWKRQSGGFIE